MARTTLRKQPPCPMAKNHLARIFDKFPDTIFVSDAQGNIVLSNSTAAMTLGMSLDQLLKSNLNDLVQKGYYTKSYAMESLEKKCVISGLLTTKLNYIMISTSTPVLDESGKVVLVVTTGRPKDLPATYADPAKKASVNRCKREFEYLRSCVLDTPAIIANSPSMQKTLLLAHAVAQTDSTVILYGESGTGKEVLAKYIHRHSKRLRESFIAVNCAAFPEQLVEAELFGYDKGAFTGASAEGKAGLFEAAHDGTLFLDEIAELPLPLQSKLLRVLETNEIRRIASTETHKINFRLIAATNKDLQQMTEEGSFRKDLFYRLNVIPLHLPPLRERPEDILALAIKFLADFNKQYETKVELDMNTLAAFQRHNWPGNVRELRNLIERKVICSLQDYPADALLSAATAASGQSDLSDCFRLLGLNGALKEVTGKFEESYIRYILNECGGRIGTAAKRLGIYRTVLYRKLKTFSQK